MWLRHGLATNAANSGALEYAERDQPARLKDIRRRAQWRTSANSWRYLSVIIRFIGAENRPIERIFIRMGESLVAREFESGIPIKVVPVPTVNTPPPGPKAAYRILSGSKCSSVSGTCHIPQTGVSRAQPVHPLLRILRLNRPTSPGLCARAPADRSLQLLPRHTSHIGHGRKPFNHRYWCDGYWLHGTRRPPVTKRSGEGEGPPSHSP